MSASESNAHYKAMQEIDRTERRYKLAFLGAAGFETVLLAVLLLAVDLKDRTHLLLLIGFVGSYTIILLALFALGVHVNRVGLRILRAIDRS